MKRFCAFMLFLVSLLCLASCAEYAAPEQLLDTFVRSYGAEGTLYSYSALEGEAGYIDTDFFETLYDREMDPECEFSVFLTNSPVSPEECAVFIAYDDTSLLYAYDLVISRVDFLKKCGICDSALVIRRGDTVFYSTFADKERAESIWRDISLKAE